MELHINKFAPSCQQNLLLQREEILKKVSKIPEKMLRYIENFMDKTRLWPKSGKAFLAVSAGADSMFLLNVFYLLKAKGRLKELSILHVNHGTRVENASEEVFLTQYASVLGLPLIIKKLNLSQQKSNFEDLARRERYHFFKNNLKDGDFIYLGHHIDDSLEWSLLSSFKSSELKVRLGIPVRRGPFARPLFCLGRRQIRFQMKKLKLPFYEDSSNLNTHYERNFIRQGILSKASSRFPSYLKHYVAQSNTLARKMGLSLFKQNEETESIFFDQGIMLQNENDLNFFPEDLIKKSICKFSLAERGRLGKQLENLKEAMKNEKWGPLHFSGGVEVHMRPGQIYIGRDVPRSLEKFDYALLEFLKTAIATQIPLNSFFTTNQNLTLTLQKILPYKFSVNLVDLGKIRPSLKKIDPLFPLSTAFAIENGFWFFYKNKIRNHKKLSKKESLFCTF